VAHLVVSRAARPLEQSARRAVHRELVREDVEGVHRGGFEVRVAGGAPARLLYVMDFDRALGRASLQRVVDLDTPLFQDRRQSPGCHRK
jgi:hypothetical protein